MNGFSYYQCGSVMREITLSESQGHEHSILGDGTRYPSERDLPLARTQPQDAGVSLLNDDLAQRHPGRIMIIGLAGG